MGEPEFAGRGRTLYELLGAYFEAVEAGVATDQQTLLTRHPELAADLAEFFREQERLHQLTEPLRPLTQPPFEEDAPARPGQSRPLATDDGLPDLRIEVPASFRTEVDGGSGLCGWRFGEYEIVREIARGGMGVVFEARQSGLNRSVALKMILGGHLASPADCWRFRNEAEAVANLDHPHIVPIYDVGEIQGLPYYSMKLMEGGNLSSRLKGGIDDVRTASMLVVSIARAVHHAHQRGVLHRDLKPSNILLDAQGEPHVTDFGLAKRIETDPSVTQSGAIVGTPSFMAPEQASGEKGAVTTATDVHGLGVILYCMLTGRPPFRGDTPLETFELVLSHEPDPPAAFNRQVDRDLQTICLKCLEKAPQRRYPSALALAEDLERWLDGKPIEARPVGRLHRAWLWCRRPHRVTHAGIFALVVGLVFALWASTAFPLLALGAIEPERPGRFAFHIARSILLCYLPMAALGGLTAARSRWAPWAGLAHSLACLGFAVGFAIGFELDAGGSLRIDDPGARIGIYSLLVCLSTLLVIGYTLAIVSLLCSRRQAARVPLLEPGFVELSTLTAPGSTVSTARTSKPEP